MFHDGRGLRFGSVAEQYDRFRPGPPPSALALLGDLNGADVLEVGAGTGLWTRALLELGARIEVVEPDDDMRDVLTRRSPDVRVIAAYAESLPFNDATFDVVLSSSAWHWFDQPAATNEMARVLRDDGRLFVLWNGFSRDVDWAVWLAEVRERPDDEHKRPCGWAADLREGSSFAVLEEVQVDWTWPRTIEEIVALFATYSGAIIRTPVERAMMEQVLRERLSTLTVADVIDVPMTVCGTIARRLPRS